MSSAYEARQVVVRLRRFVAALVAMLAAAFIAFAAGAQAEGVPTPAWKVVAATGPTNLPPKQSEVQRVTIGAEAGAGDGTVTYSRKSGQGVGTPVVGEGFLTYTTGDPVATIESVAGGLTFEVGARVTAPGFAGATETRIVSCSSDCSTPGTTVTLSNAPTQTKATGQKVVIFTKTLKNVTGTYFVGDELSSEYLSPGTVVTAVGSGTITASRATNFPYTELFGAIPLTGTQATGPVAFDASPEELEDALEAGLPSLGPGGVEVTGGPGGEADQPYFLAFGGGLAETNIEPLTAIGSELGEHGYVHVVTTVQGGPGTGEVAIFPTNVGGAATSGAITVKLGPLPAGIVTNGPAKGDAEGSWTCTTQETEIECTTAASIGALKPTGAITVPIKVESSIGSSSSVPVTVSGGGAAAASYQVPLNVTPQPASAGIAALLSGVFNEDGTPATQAGGHPYSQITAFHLNSRRAQNGRIVPSGDIKDVMVDLPPGLVGNPLITERCAQGLPVPPINVETPACNEQEKMKYAVGWLFPGTGNFGQVSVGAVTAPYYNNVPVAGAAAQFSTKVAAPVATLGAGIRSDEDFGIQVRAINNTVFQNIYYLNSVFYGEPVGGNGKAFFRNATSCVDQARSAQANELLQSVEMTTWQQSTVSTGAIQAQQPVTGCDKLKGLFQPQFSFQPTSTQGSSGVGATAHLHFDQQNLTNPDQLGTPDLQQSVVTLPQGFTINPSQANGLAACTVAQVGYLGRGALPNPTRFNNAPVSCPDGSKLGTAEIETPLLEDPLLGTIYLAAQEENPFGSLIAIYLVVESPRYGITLKLPGRVDTDPRTGQVSATFEYVPQQPVEDLTLHFRGGGPRSEFATPEVCGAYSTNGTWTPWSAPESGPPAQTGNGFSVSTGCSPSAATRPFRPTFEAGSVNPIAGAYSPLVIKLGRNDGEQELNSLAFTLPQGMVGRLAGVPYCSDAAIAAAGGRTGKAELAAPSCSPASQIGTVDVGAGVGSQPFHVGGSVYLAGPYKGAPLSAVVITPSVAGPFDLGNVVVRSPLYVNPETAQITVQSDPIPTILRGIPLKVRSVTVQIDRQGFSLNPTNCEAMAASATVGSSDGATATPSNRFQVGNCEALAFKPKLKLQLKGATKRSGNPALKAVLTQRAGQANISRTVVMLPPSSFIDNEHINNPCTRAQYAAGACPKGSFLGNATAWSPLLDEPLKGPVIFRSNGGVRELPDLVVALHGQIDIELVGFIDSVQNKKTDTSRVRTTFAVVPDAPVSRFVLNMKGGKKGLIENSRNLCKGKQIATVKMAAHNGRRSETDSAVQVQCKGKSRKEAQRRHRR